MEVKASLNYLRISPRKVRLVSDLIKGMKAERAQIQLRFLKKKSAAPLLKLLNSAIANAKNNFSLEEKNLFIKNIIVNQAPNLKRWRPRAFGRAAQVLKRGSHIMIILEEEAGSKKARKTKIEKEAEKTEKIQEPVKKVESEDKKFVKPAPRMVEKTKQPTKKLIAPIRKIFQRKAI